jgi:phenylacetate-CoA ligase
MGMSEFGFVGLGCHDGTLHLNDKDFFLEFVKLNPEAEADDLWELMITSVGDRLCPHIRYRTNDVYRLLGPCSCGSAMPAVVFQGRSKDLVRLQSGKVITPSDLDAAVGAPPWIDIFQLSYQRPSTFIFRYRGDAQLFDEAELRVLREKLEALLQSSNVRIESVQYFPFERGGKFQLIRTN